ncbi:hypothetical protein IV203_002260 [Nitzschia inconspicua]|uniref:Uncharacterized protein n=1 Tax=Nitzschia inconspicua TaxID=303405 RepID=A0A9K3L8R4_9STRA|nr:hypothetical protein IV203_002260 [Nitzschia inconspicua]
MVSNRPPQPPQMQPHQKHIPSILDFMRHNEEMLTGQVQLLIEEMQLLRDIMRREELSVNSNNAWVVAQPKVNSVGHQPNVADIHRPPPMSSFPGASASMQPNNKDIGASDSVPPIVVRSQCLPRAELAPVSSASLLPNVAGNQGPPQTESVQPSSAFMPQQQAETIDGSSPNESVEQSYEKILAERDYFEKMATLYKNQRHSYRCLLMLGFSGVFHAIDASYLGAQRGVASSDRLKWHPFMRSFYAFLRDNNTWEKAETALDSNKSRKEKHKLCLEIIGQFESFMLSYPGMAETQTVEPTFNQQAESAQQPSSTRGTIKQTSTPTSNSAPMINCKANAVASTPGTIKQTSTPTSNAAPMIQANAVASTDEIARQIKDIPTSLELVAAPDAASVALSTVESVPLKSVPDYPSQKKQATGQFRTEKEKTRAIQQILHKLMPVGVSLENSGEHYVQLQQTLTQPRTEQHPELPGGMTIRKRVRKSMLDTDQSKGAEWVRKARTLLGKHGTEEDLYRLLFLVKQHFIFNESHPGLALAEVFGKESRDDDDEIEVIDPPTQAKAPVWDLENPSEVAQYLFGEPRTGIRIKKEVPSPTKIAGLFEQIQLDSDSTHIVL